jgi:lipopolysaccharide assembly LptE-like protein
MKKNSKSVGGIRRDADRRTGGPRYLLPTSFISEPRSSIPDSRLPTPDSLFYCLLLSAFCFLNSSCGYHVAGRGDRLGPDIKTIAIPIFVNKSPRFKIEQMLSGAITREFIERTKFRITPDPGQADAVLNGTVTGVSSGVAAYDLTTGRATTLQIQVVAKVELVDSHTKQVLFSNQGYVFREQYQISQSSPSLFEEDQPALERLSRDMARTLVTDILENF